MRGIRHPEQVVGALIAMSITALVLAETFFRVGIVSGRVNQLVAIAALLMLGHVGVRTLAERVDRIEAGPFVVNFVDDENDTTKSEGGE